MSTNNAGASPTSGGGDAGAADVAVGAGGSGGTTSSSGLVDGCADLDTDGVADCTTTLVENPSFTTDVKSWTALVGTALTWDEKNALDDTPSGSAKIESHAARGSATQCVAAKGQGLAIAYADAFVSAPSAGDKPVVAELEVSFFDSKDCSGERTYFETPPTAAVDTWVVVQAGAVSPSTTQSISVALVGIAPVGSVQVEAYFDNIMLKVKDL